MCSAHARYQPLCPQVDYSIYSYALQPRVYCATASAARVLCNLSTGATGQFGVTPKNLILLYKQRSNAISPSATTVRHFYHGFLCAVQPRAYCATASVARVLCSLSTGATSQFGVTPKHLPV